MRTKSRTIAAGVALLTCAAPAVAHHGFKLWEHAGFAWYGKGDTHGDNGPVFVFVFGIAISVLCLGVLALRRGKRDSN